MKIPFHYLYGPVSSWRLGRSLGIDPIATKSKMCNFDCIYCQLGRTGCYVHDRLEFVPTGAVLDEVARLPPSLKIDYLTFSGRGEPTLAVNLGKMITGLHKLRPEKIAVITNSAMLCRPDVQEDLAMADYVLAKLDAGSPEAFARIDHAVHDITFAAILDGIRSFKHFFEGRLALQIMLMPENKADAPAIAQIARVINPDEVQLNTPLRPCGVKPLRKEELDEIKVHFQGMPVVSVYDSASPEVEPFDERQTRIRHGNIYQNQTP